MRLLLIALIRIYQYTLSPLIAFISGGDVCRFEPSCSHYAVDALKTHGALRGSWLATKRIFRCHPWGGQGHDPVPPEKKERKNPRAPLKRSREQPMSQDLLATLKPHASAESLTWLQDSLAKTGGELEPRPFYYAFSGASRHFDKHNIIDGVASDQLARKALLLALAEQPRDIYLATLEKLLGSADIREASVLYSTFPDLPHPDDLLPHAREATRSNVVDIFDAIALDNPFPRDHFPEEAWNQLVLKSLFISRPLHRMIGLEDRANLHLAKQISDLAHERWAAGRELNPEAWRNCADYLDDRTILTDLQSLAERSDNEKRALALVHSHSESNANKLASTQSTIDPYLSEIESGNLTWTTLGKTLEAETP